MIVIGKKYFAKKGPGVEDTPGYEQMREFEESVTKLIKDTIEGLHQ